MQFVSPISSVDTECGLPPTFSDSKVCIIVSACYNFDIHLYAVLIAFFYNYLFFEYQYSAA